MFHPHNPFPLVLILVGSFVSRGLAQDQASVDLLFERVSIGVVAKDISEFSKKATETIGKAWSPVPENLVSEMYYRQLGEIDVDQTINRSGPGGVLLLDDFSRLGWLYPVKNLEGVATHFGINADSLRKGEPLRTNKGALVYRNNAMLMFNRITSTEAGNPFENFRSVGSQLSQAERVTFGGCDAVVMLDGKNSSGFWGQNLGNLFGPGAMASVSGFSNEQDQQMWNRLQAAGKEIRFGLAALNLDGGLHLHTKTFFEDKADSAAKKLIREIRGGDQPSDLRYLPATRFLAATAARGRGEQNALIAKSIVRLIVESVSPGEEILAAEDKKIFYQSFEKIWRQLNGTRMALYRNDGEIGEGGELALVSIFDIDQPMAFLADLPSLVEFANRGISRKSAGGNRPTIQFEYRSAAEQIGKHHVDLLEIDTSRINKKNADRFVRFFGKNANQIRFVSVQNQLVMFVGTNPEFLSQTIKNILEDKPGLAAHPAVVASNAKIDSRRKIELHFSANNLNSIYSATIRKRKDLGKYRPPAELTSMGLVIEEDRFGFDLWIPSYELNRGVKLLMRQGF